MHRHVNPLVLAAFAVVSSQQSALGPRGWLWPVLLMCNPKGRLCPSSGDINKLIMMMMMRIILLSLFNICLRMVEVRDVYLFCLFICVIGTLLDNFNEVSSPNCLTQNLWIYSYIL
jgi:hypothetical protein